jgi:chemotaxis protein MotB
MAEQKSIIIKRVKKTAREGGHGGSWKVAYADFVTAMMAFFLLLWLITMVSPEKRARVASYFKYYAIFEKSGISMLEGSGKDVLYLGGDGVNIPQERGKPGKSTNIKKTPQQLKEEVVGRIQSNLGHLKGQVIIEDFKDNVRIEIVDSEGAPIFPVGDSSLTQNGKKLLKEITESLLDIDNKIVIEGHTDALSYKSNKYTNWELSTARASVARSEMEALGLNPDRISMVSGYAATKPLIKDNPNDPRNRRVSIVVLFENQEL